MFGVFWWKPDGIYYSGEAVHVYKRDADAERRARRIGAVVRETPGTYVREREITGRTEDAPLPHRPDRRDL
jgi:hypothetical protein